MSEPQETPKFNSFEEIEEWLNSQKNTENSETTGSTSTDSETPTMVSGSTKTGSSPKNKKGSSKKKKPAPKVAPVKDESAPVGKPDPSIWSVIHFYTQPGDSFNKTRIDAKEEAGFRSSNVAVFYHDHLWGEDCSTRCAGVNND